MPSGSSGSVRTFYPSHSRQELTRLLASRLPVLRARLPATRVVLFGSWATGHATAFSDVDLLVVYAGPSREDAYRVVRESVALRGLEPQVYSEEVAAGLRQTLERMTRGGIVIL